jgi:hypothetical protein
MAKASSKRKELSDVTIDKDLDFILQLTNLPVSFKYTKRDLNGSETKHLLPNRFDIDSEVFEEVDIGLIIGAKLTAKMSKYSPLDYNDFTSWTEFETSRSHELHQLLNEGLSEIKEMQVNMTSTSQMFGSKTKWQLMSGKDLITIAKGGGGSIKQISRFDDLVFKIYDRQLIQNVNLPPKCVWFCQTLFIEEIGNKVVSSMEKMDGSLSSLRIGMSWVDYLIFSVCLQSYNISHLDIKPQNILVKKVNGNRLLLLADFDGSIIRRNPAKIHFYSDGFLPVNTRCDSYSIDVYALAKTWAITMDWDNYTMDDRILSERLGPLRDLLSQDSIRRMICNDMMINTFKMVVRLVLNRCLGDNETMMTHHRQRRHYYDNR